jgi:hypothetical protein
MALKAAVARYNMTFINAVELKKSRKVEKEKQRKVVERPGAIISSAIKN